MCLDYVSHELLKKVFTTRKSITQRSIAEKSITLKSHPRLKTIPFKSHLIDIIFNVLNELHTDIFLVGDVSRVLFQFFLNF